MTGEMSVKQLKYEISTMERRIKKLEEKNKNADYEKDLVKHWKRVLRKMGG